MENDQRSLTPCLDENAVDQNQKSISDLSDISDEDEKNWEDLQKTEGNKNNKKVSSEIFKKITKSARDRNYRDKSGKGSRHESKNNEDRSKRSQKRSEIQRYNVRNIIRDGREFSFSRSRSRSKSPVDKYYGHQKKILKSPVRSRHNSDSRRYSSRHFSSRRSRSGSDHRKHSDKNAKTTNSSDKTSRRKGFSSKKQDNYRSSSLEGKKIYVDESRSRHRKKSRSQSPIIEMKKLSSNSTQNSSRQIKNMSQENIKVILQNKEVIPKRSVKHLRKDKKSKKQTKDDETNDKTTKSYNANAQTNEGISSKEVIASGDNILISVSFNNKNNIQKERAREKSVEILTKSPERKKPNSPKSPPETGGSVKKSKLKRKKDKKHPKVTSNQNNPNFRKNIRKNDLKPIAFIDLEKSPGNQVSTSPKEIIVLSDSDNDCNKKENNTSKDLMIVENTSEEADVPASPAQPVLKFSIHKKSNILPFNLLHDHEDENNEKDEEMKESAESHEKLSNDAYDPFNPTNSKSNSPVHLQQILNDVSSSSDMIKNRKDSPSNEKNCIDENLISSTNSMRNEKKLSPSPLSSSLSNTKSSTFHDNNFEFKTFKVPSPKVMSIEKKSLNTEEDETTPYSPCSDGYQYEPAMEPESPPKELDASNDSCFNDDLKKKNMPKNAGNLTNFKSLQDAQLARKSNSKFDQTMIDLHSTQKSPHSKRQSTSSSFLRSKMKRYRNSLMDIDALLKPPMFTDKPSGGKDDPFVDEDVPNSAVDLLNKDKIFKKSLRIERVAEEVKLVLKPHYNKKHITKEEYKEILRKAVPKIYHNKTGEINIQKIHNLVEAYIKKFRYRRKSTQNVNL